MITMPTRMMSSASKRVLSFTFSRKMMMAGGKVLWTALLVYFLAIMWSLVSESVFIGLLQCITIYNLVKFQKYVLLF